MASVWRLTPIVFGLALGGCVERTNSRDYFVHDGPDVVITGAGPKAPVTVGQSAAFVIKVANTGNEVAKNVRVTDTPGAQSDLVSITCAGADHATCPKDVKPDMVVPELPVGGSLTFTATLKLKEPITGVIINTLVAFSDGDPDPNNNSLVLDALVR
jgi:uncharacterized repeat protein (TIGR01451 family)